jgi:hypothetical protein
MKNYKICDKKAPRFRISKYRNNLVSEELWRDFKKKYDSQITYKSYKEIFKKISEKIIEATVDNRDGVMLDQHLGKTRLILFKPQDKILNVDAARNLGIGVNYMMFNTDGLQGKIEWSLKDVKYKLRNSRLFGFKPHRNFSKAASKAFTNQPDNYVIIDILGGQRRNQIKKLLKDELQLNSERGTESNQSSQ